MPQAGFRFVLFVLLLAALPVTARCQEQAIRLSSPALEAQLSFNFARCVAAGTGGAVHVVWFDTAVRYRRSTDGGLNWEESVELSALDSGAQYPAVATEGEAVYVVWHEIGDGTPRIVMRRSLDGGASWELERRLTDARIASSHPSIAASRGRVHLTWFDGRHDLTEIYSLRSSDGGVTWENEVRISDTDSESWVATIETEGDLVLIGWVDYQDGNEEEYLRSSDDGGATWSPPVRMTNDEADSWAPSIAISGSTVHFAWFDRRDAGLTDADVEAKLDEALTLVGLHPTPSPPRDPRSYYLPQFITRLRAKVNFLSQAVPQWVSSGGDPRVIDEIMAEFNRLLDTWTYGWEIYYKRSIDGGRSFGPDTRLTFAPGLSQRPSIAAEGDRVAMVWFDQRDDGVTTEIYAKLSSDGGLSWGTDLRLTRAAGDSDLASMVRVGDVVHLIWRGARTGIRGIYYERIPLEPRRRPIRPE